MIIEAISFASLILIIAMLRRIVTTFPKIVVCVARWKENINLEENIKLSRDRDFIAAALAIPFCLTVYENGLVSFRFMSGMSQEAAFGVTAATFVLYYLFRQFTISVFIPRRKKRGATKAACNCERTYFTILAAILLLTQCLSDITGMTPSDTNRTMLWISAAAYLLFLIRKYQIFESSHPIFTSFLYLCALEIIPTGTLIVSAIIF